MHIPPYSNTNNNIILFPTAGSNHGKRSSLRRCVWTSARYERRSNEAKREGEDSNNLPRHHFFGPRTAISGAGMSRTISAISRRAPMRRTGSGSNLAISLAAQSVMRHNQRHLSRMVNMSGTTAWKLRSRSRIIFRKSSRPADHPELSILPRRWR